MLTTPYTDKMYNDTLTNGGATVDLTRHNLTEPSGKFFVGAGKEAWVHRIPVESFTPAYLASLVYLAKKEGYYALGTWVDGGTVYVEPTFTYDTEEAAYLTAETLGEQAYFNTETRETIRIFR